MLEAFLPKTARRVVVYLKPINVRWGANKLDGLCREVLHIEPNERTCFLFVNNRRDTLVLYSISGTGAETLLRKLDKGSFILPAPNADGTPYVILRPAVLQRLLRG